MESWKENVVPPWGLAGPTTDKADDYKAESIYTGLKIHMALD